jgi:hypothetical protein
VQRSTKGQAMIELMKIARKNRHYYLSEQKADNTANPWYRYVKTMDSYSEAVLLSPSMARELLDSDTDSALRKPPSAGELENVRPLSISFSGKLLSGHSTLQAVAMSEKSVIVYISFNISDKLSFLFG